MKKQTIILFIFFSSIYCFSQEHIIFAHQNTIYEKHNEYVGESENQPNFDDINSNSHLFSMGMFTINYSKIKNRFFQEYTLMPFFIQQKYYEKIYDDGSYVQVVDGYNYLNIRTHLSYKFSIFLRNTKKNFLPYIGIGSRIYWNHESYYPIISRHYPRKFNYYGHLLLANIGFIYRITDYMYIKFTNSCNYYGFIYFC